MRSRSGRGNRVEDVGGGDEQHLGQVERHVEVVIAEGVVLLRVEHLEQRRRRVAAEVGAELVDLVEHEDRVLRLGAAQALDDLAGQRADVGAAMAADLGLVAHAAERDAHELAPERPARSSAPSDVLPTPGGPTKHRMGPFSAGLQLAHGQVFEDAVLDLLEAVVVLVEHVLGLRQVDHLVGPLRPRQGRRSSRGRCAPRCTRRRRAASSTGDRARAAPPSSPPRAGRRPRASRAAPRSRAVCSSPSPSSFWMALSCSRRKYSRWFLPTSDCTCDWIFEPSSRTSSSLISSRLSRSRRARTSSVCSTSCLVSVRDGAEARGDEVRQPPGSVMFEASACRSSDISGDSETICWKLVLMLRCSASISRRSSSFRISGASVTRAAQVGTRRGDLVEPHAGQALHDDAQAAVGQLEHLVDLAGGADRMEIASAAARLRPLRAARRRRSSGRWRPLRQSA